MTRYEWHKEEIGELMNLLASYDKDKIENLFDKILTPRELNDMARRLKVLKMLEEGKSYSDIQMELGMSSVTISKLSNKIGFGFQKQSNPTQIKSSSKKTKKSSKIRKYKGVTPIHRILD